MEKINLIRKYNEFIFVPYARNSAAKILLGRDIADRHKNQNGVCIGKIFFIDDYFHIPQYVYNMNLYTATSDEHLNSELDNFGIIIEMPIKSTVSNNQILQVIIEFIITKRISVLFYFYLFLAYSDSKKQS